MIDTEFSKELISEMMKERKRDRFWKNVRTSFIILVALMGIGTMSNVAKTFSEEGSTAGALDKEYVSLIRLNGEIGPGQEFSAEAINPLLVDAFEDKEAKGVVLVINSPGGTPVQASLINQRILELKKEFAPKKVIVVGEDMLTSGAYMVAVAADKIYVNRSTVAGSIGVISGGFGFDKAIEKLGVDRRVHHAGVNKGRMDPFLPENPADVAKLTSVLDKIHGHFKDTVKEGRKGKLKGSEEDLFSGDFWTGEDALALGLVDGISDLPSVLNTEFKVKKFRLYEPTRSFFGPIGKYLSNSKTILDLVTSENKLKPLLLPQ